MNLLIEALAASRQLFTVKPIQAYHSASNLNLSDNKTGAIEPFPDRQKARKSPENRRKGGRYTLLQGDIYRIALV
jgi:hypothetical protein